MTYRPRIAVDFDGVIHSYSSPWEGPTVIPDDPVPGAIEWLNSLGDEFKLCILTTRAETEGGRAAVTLWLHAHGLSVPFEVTCQKLPALMYIDDRAWRFTGANFPSVQEIYAAKSWCQS